MPFGGGRAFCRGYKRSPGHCGKAVFRFLTTVAIVGIASDTEAMSEYLLDEMTIRMVQYKKLTVADRGNLEAIKKEMDFQLSGEVSDDSIKEIGAMVGADVVLHGNLKKIGGDFMLTLQALDVTKATWRRRKGNKHWRPVFHKGKRDYRGKKPSFWLGLLFCWTYRRWSIHFYSTGNRLGT